MIMLLDFMFAFMWFIVIAVVSWILAGYITDKFYVPSDKKKEDIFDKFD